MDNKSSICYNKSKDNKGYKMTMKVGMRELARNSNILDGYDYIEVEDKKTHEYKGLFVSPRYAEEFKKYLEDKISKEQQEKVDRIKKFAGRGEIYKRYDNLTSGQIKEKKSIEQYGEK